ncbi:MAG: hypothetical protein IH577_01505 [Deltaproteobacteria bacterium]|nr:hypothetical protein [Deltaproteobacteria bacterium]
MAEKDVEQILAAAEQAVKLRDAAVKVWGMVLKIFDDHLDSLAGSSADLSSKALFSRDSREIFSQDFTAQRKRIKEHARELSASPDKSIAILQRIVEKGMEYSSKDTYRYHPDVVAASKNEILALVKAAQGVFVTGGKG